MNGDVGQPTTRRGGFLAGMTIIAASILFGRSYLFFLSFGLFSIVMTLWWRHRPRSWINLVSVSAATPISISKQHFPCNLLFALWFTASNPGYLLRLPKWVYLPFLLVLLGLVTSAVNWLSGDIVRSIMRQGAYAYNFIMAPFIMIPVIYVRMRETTGSAENLSGLLFCLLLPSTLLLLSARTFGTVHNPWEASLHVNSLPQGFLQYKLGGVVVNFLRTEVGFILAALICVSTAIAISKVAAAHRIVAGGCLASNAYLLLDTGSFGSGFACLCGLGAIFCTQLRTASPVRVAASTVAIFSMLLLVYGLSPPAVKDYLGQRYEHRVTNADKDRVTLWKRAVDHLVEHPEGTGLTLSVGDTVKSVIHNDYLAYAVSYGVAGGLAYTALVLCMVVSLWRRRQMDGDSCGSAIRLAGLGAVVTVAVNSMTDHLMENRWYFNLLWSLIWYSYFCTSVPEEAPGEVADVAGVECAAGDCARRGGHDHDDAAGW